MTGPIRKFVPPLESRPALVASSPAATSLRWLFFVTIIVMVTPLASCGSNSKTKWKDHMADWYNNSSVTPPEPEHSRWERREWDRFLQRIGHADAAAVGSLKVLSVYSVFRTPKQVSLEFSPTEILHGSFEGMSSADRSLELTLAEGDDDFEIAIRAQQHVAGTRYLLFAKVKPQSRKWGPPKGWRGSLWRDKSSKERKDFRWVLYRPDTALLARVRTMYRWLKQK